MTLEESHTSIGASALVAFSLMLLATYVHSWLCSFPAKPHSGHEPPIVPYYLPYLGHISQYLRNPGGFLQKVSKGYPNTPFSILLPGAKFHIITNPNTAFYIFTKPREFICEPVVASMMSNGLELDGPDYDKFNVPISPHKKSPDFTLEQQESFTFVSRNHGLYLKHLSGKTLDPILQLYKKNLLRLIGQGLPTQPGSSNSIQLHKTLRKLVFDASSVTFFGTRLLQLSPNLWEDWWSFDEAAYIGVRSRASFYLRPWTLAGRRRMLEALDEWVETDLEPWSHERGVWCDKWGVKLNWEREHMARDHNMTTRGRSCVHASFLWVIITNTAPMLTWTIGALLANPSVLSEFRRNVETFMSHGIEEFRVADFAAEPFIQAFWKEVLRLGVTSSAARVVSRDSEIEGYVVRKGSVILVPSRVLHFDPSVFEDPETFNPSRWLARDDSGQGLPEKIKRQNTSLRPFGGGTGVCPGRFIAEQEVLLTAAVLVHLFDLEVDSGQDIPFPNLSPKALGAMHPIIDPYVTVSRRKCMETDEQRARRNTIRQ